MTKNAKLSQIKIFLMFVGLFFSLSLILVAVKIEYSSSLVIGFVTDIHAGDQEIREDGADAENIIFPNRFEKNFKKALIGMGNANLIFSLGDNLNRPGRKNTKKLAWISRNYPMYWTRGNHDKLNQFQEILSKERYYYVDKRDWRIIVLDNGGVFPDTGYHEEYGRGYIDKNQMDWLKEVLKTEKNIIVAMHIPMVSRSLDKIRDDYKELENLFIENKKVKHILAGHYHIYNKEINISGITYHLIPSLSLKNYEGYYYKLEL